MSFLGKYNGIKSKFKANVRVKPTISISSCYETDFNGVPFNAEMPVNKTTSVLLKLPVGTKIRFDANMFERGKFTCVSNIQVEGV